MAAGRASTSSALATRRGAIAWLALGWLVFVAWLALLGLNATPYLSGRPMPPPGELLARLIALPAALRLPAALAASAAWMVAALALFIGVVTLALTITSLRGGTAAPKTPPASAPVAAPPLTPPTPPPLTTPATAPSAPALPPAGLPAPEPAPAAPPASHRATPAPMDAPPRIFISHSSADDDFGRRLEQRLKAALGDPDAVFYDSDGGLKGGDQWPERLQRELGQRDIFVLILSPRAAASPWVRKEWNYALMQATSIGGKIIVPLMRQETELWPFLADIQVIDFKDPTRFEAAFADLLVAVRLGRTRQAELVGPRGVRRGPPFDLDRLPLQERFIGRNDDIEWALERLAPELSLRSPRVVDVGNGRLGSRLASIAAANGLAGIGKSALAGVLARMLHATGRYPDGIAVVACNDLTDPVSVLRGALARFDLDENKPPEQTVEQLSGLAQRVFARATRALIILDNVEPALKDIAQVTNPLRVAGAALLLTSRQRLPAAAVSANDSRELELLSQAEAVAVFLENRERVEQSSAQAAQSEDVSEADRAAIAQIVEALGRHTLAVKLAAPRSRGRDLARFAREYAADPRLGLALRDGTEAVDVVMSSSVASAPANARQLFAALGAFASNDIGRDALLAVGGALGDADPAASLDALLDARLADAYLSAELPAGADNERLRLHPLVRAFARDLLDGARAVADDPPWPAERRTAAERAVSAWYATYANNIGTPDEARLLDEANIGGALAWVAADGDDRLLAHLANGMMNFWETRSRTEARRAYLPPAVEAARRVATASDVRDDHLRAARLELAQGALLQMLGDLPGARRLIERSLEARIKYDDVREEGVARSLLGDVARQEGDLPAARDAYTRVLAIMQQVGDVRGEGIARGKLGDVALQEGDLPAARAAYTRYLAIMQQVGDVRGEGVARSLLGDVARQEGDLPAARAAYTRYLAIMQQAGDVREEGVALIKTAQVSEQLDDLQQAETSYRQALDILRRVNSPPDIADTQLLLGRFLVEHGRDSAEGRRMLGEAAAIYMKLGPAWAWQEQMARELLDQTGGGGE